MAIESDTNKPLREIGGRALGRLHGFRRAIADRAPGLLTRMSKAWRWLVDVAGVMALSIATWARRTWLMRFISRTLLRRIVASNLLGLVIVLLGLLYLTKFNNWLIDAKIEHLQTQSRSLAAAIGQRGILTEVAPRSGASGKSTYDALRDDPFAAIEFSLKPERVTPILPALLEGTDNRARVYGANGNLIADSSRIFAGGELITGNKPQRKPKNFWTRVVRELLWSDLDVYKDIGDANGRSYPEVRRALAGETSALLMLTKFGEQIVSVAAPIKRGNETRGALLLSTSPGAIDEVQAKQLFNVLILLLIASAAAILASVLLERTVAEPMRRLSNAAEAVTHDIQAAKDLPRLRNRVDEVGQLTRAMRVMANALYRRIEASEKFAADVAHELKNPLAAARATSESLEYARDEAQRDELIRQIQLEIRRLDRLISDVSNASRLDAELALQKFEPVDLSKVAENLVAMFQDVHSGEDRQILLNVEHNSSELPYLVTGQEGRLGQVLTNLISNALSFSPPNSTVWVRLRRYGDDMIDLVVEDEGPGIPEDKLDTIFKRFYTYRPTAQSSRGDNSGLGLSISREIIEAHGGTIWAENRGPPPADVASDDAAPSGGRTGARLTVRIPVASTAVPSANRRLGGGRERA